MEDARLHKAHKQIAKFQISLLATEQKLSEYVEDLVRSAGMIKSAQEPEGRASWEDYPQWIKDLKGWYYDEREKKIKECTMWDYTNEMTLDRSAWLIGRAGLGKSSLQRVWARFQGRSENKGHYVEGKSIDPLGVLSKNGGLRDVGCLCLADFDFRTLQKEKLTLNDIKSLVCVGEIGHIKARYGDAAMPEDMSRVFSINLEFNPETNMQNDPAGFFVSKGLHGMADVVNKDAARLATLDDAELAIVRRSVIFVLDDSMNLKIDKKAAGIERASRLAQREFNREQYRKSQM